MLPLAKKRILSFLFTALVVAPMFFFMPVTVTPKGVGVNIVEAGAASCLYWMAGCIQFLTGSGDNCGYLGWRCATRDLLELILVKIPAFFFGLAGVVFDTLVAFSLSSTIIKNQAFVDKGWVIMRDLSNTFFIFVLLYIAISTILQTAGGQTKRLLATLVMVALFMNFSLYITKFVIDVSNVFALEFYTNMGVVGQAYVNLGPNDIQPRSISFAFNDAFKLQTLFGPAFLTQAAGDLPLSAFIFTLVGIMYMVAAFVFLSAGFLFLARVVAFWFLMILSPLAFFSMILPYTRGKIWSRWSSELVSQSFFAPIFLFFIYLTLMLADTLGGTLFKKGTNTLSGDMSFLQTTFIAFLTFFALITTLLFGLKTAKSMSGTLGESMLKIGGTVTGAAVGAGAWAGRNSFGRAAQYYADKKGDEWKKSKMGQLYLSGTNKVANSSFDVRASKIGQVAQTTVGGINLGAAGGAGGFSKTAGDKAAANKKMCDSLKNDPAAFAKCIASLRDTLSVQTADGSGRGLNPDGDAMKYWSTLSVRERQEAKAAATGADKSYLDSLDKKLTSGFKDKQQKAEEKGMRAFGKERAQETLEEYEALGTMGERMKYLQDNLSGLTPNESKARRLTILRSSTAAQRAEIEKYETDTGVAADKKFFAGIDQSAQSTDLTREESSKILEQNKKYKDLSSENDAKEAQKKRVDKIDALISAYNEGRGADLVTLQNQARVHIGEMNNNEIAALSGEYLASSIIAPHINKEILAKVEKGDKIKLTYDQKEALYKNLKENNPEMKKYLEERESVGSPSDGARRRFRGGTDNKNQGGGKSS